MDIPILNMLIRSGWVARLVLLLLLGFSFLTWAVIINRFLFLAKIQKLNKRYRTFFDKISVLSQLQGAGKDIEECPLGKLGHVTLQEYQRILEDAKMHTAVSDWSFYLQNQFYMVKERLGAVSSNLSSSLDRGVFILAVISSVAPFLGLLGTVWGIMNSFFEIGNQGSASLPVVAPGIAEALITTVAGLVVAIPSVFFYNIFVHRAERIEDQMDEFEDHLTLQLKRELFNLLYSGKQKPDVV